MYGTDLDQVGSNMAKLDQLGQVGCHFVVFCLLREAPLTNLDQVGPVLFPTVFRALLIEVANRKLEAPAALEHDDVFLGPATTQNLVVKFDGEICGGVLVEHASDDFPSKRSSKISFQTSPEVRHQFRRKLRQLHSGNRWCFFFPRRDSRESPRFVLRIAGPSKSLIRLNF